MQKPSRLALITLPLLALLTLSSPLADEQPGPASTASPESTTSVLPEATAPAAQAEPADGEVVEGASTVDDAADTEKAAPTEPQEPQEPQEAPRETQETQETQELKNPQEAEETQEQKASKPEEAKKAAAPTDSAEPKAEDGMPASLAEEAPASEEDAGQAAGDVSETTAAPPTDGMATETAGQPSAADATATMTPAPIVDATPPHRAENVDLREVILKPGLPSVSTPTPEVVATDNPPPVPSKGKPLVLLGTEVPPSTAARLAWSPSESFAGIAAPTPVLVINGAQPGPVLCLTAAIHGDELVGIEVVRRVLYAIDAQQLSGALIGVPIVNLQGFRRGSRYLPDRRDLNRYFPGNTYGSSASRIAYSFFNEIVKKCDVLVDLHTGSFHRTNLPQVRADLNNADVTALSKGLGATAVLQSRGSRGSLRRAAVEVGIPAVTLEAGEPMRLSEEPVEHGVHSIESLLDNLGMLKTRGIWSRREQPVFYKSTWVRANEGGVLMSKVRLGQKIEVGDLLGTVSDPITNAQHDIVSPYAGRIIGMALNQVMMPGFAAYHIGIQASVEEAAEPDPTLDTAIDELDDEDAELTPEAPAESAGKPVPAEADIAVPEDSE